ncbi:PucR family transcriptional regulator [Parasphingorhabdus pacifica]
MVKLDRLINVLGGYGARLCTAPPDRQAWLRGVAVCDPAEGDSSANEVLLAIGIDADQDSDLLAETQAVVVVFRREHIGDPALAVARERGVAVVLVDPAVSWGQVAGVIYGLVLEGRETEAGRGPTDLFTLADSLAESVGGPVTIEDHHSGVLAYSRSQESADRARSQTILGRRVPERIRRELDARGVFAHVAVSDDPLFVEPIAEGFQGRVVAAVRAGRELLGSIWVESRRPLENSHRVALVEGARTAALHMLRARASADLERQVESDLVLRVLEGSADAQAIVSRLGLAGERFRVVALQVRARGDQSATLLAFEAATVGFGWARSTRSALFANTVYTIMNGDDDPERALEWVRELVRELPAEVALSAGIGGTADALRLQASRQEADEALAVHAADPERAAVVYDEAWHEILLWRLRAAASTGRTPSRGPIAELRGFDRANGTHYVATLRAWLECQGDVGAAASRLSVHPNTVRYRMRGMAGVTSLRLDDPESRLAMIIALAAT